MNKNRKSKPVTGGKTENRNGEGGKAGAKGHKAMVTAKYAKHANKQRHELDRQDACPTTGRRKLVSILEKYDVSVAGFDGLRADTYEKHLAKRSLEELEEPCRSLLKPGEGYGKIPEKHIAKRSWDGLETPYNTLLHPGKTYEKNRETCARWDADSKCQGQLRSDGCGKPVAKLSIHGLEQGYLTLLKAIEPWAVKQDKFSRWRLGRPAYVATN